MSVIIEMRNITKRFKEVMANDRVNFEVKKGEIHALFGENGAGKTTLMNILYGLYKPDQGEIYLRGKEVEISSPADAIRLGIGRVPQFAELVPSFSVAENIALGLKEAKFSFTKKDATKRMEEFSEKYELEVNPHSYFGQLSTGEKQKVEIIRVLARNPEILILDEPTTNLVLPEIEELFSLLHRMTQEGRSVIFIAHKLEEVMKISDRVTVLRNGKRVKTLDTLKTTKQELINLAVSKEINFRVEKAEEPIRKKEKIFEVKDLWVLSVTNLPVVKGVSFEILQGEILGIAGIAGNGQRELVETITGLRSPVKGKILLKGEEITDLSPREILDKGVAHIPENREIGIAPGLSLLKNLTLIDYSNPRFSGRLFLNFRAMRERAKKLVSEYEIDTPSLDTPIKSLSGGNRQKAILARELSRDPQLIVASHPTFGLDIRTATRIRKIFREHQKKGAAILLISEDLEEIVKLSNVIGVMVEGEIRDLKENRKLTLKEIQSIMAGGGLRDELSFTA